MKKQLFILTLLVSASLYSSGQITFQKTYGGINTDGGHSVQQTTDGGYIITGYTGNFGSVSTGVYLIKTDEYGDTLWTKIFGGSGYDVGRFVRQTADGGYIIAGYTTSFGAGGGDFYLIKTDANGNSLWSKTFGGTNFEVAYYVQQTTDGGYIIGGATQSFGAGSLDFYVIKTDVNGDSLWSKSYGRTGLDDFWYMQQTADGGYIITGSSVDTSTSFEDVYLVKTDANGDTLWTKTIGGTNDDVGTCLQQTTDGGYIITGVTNSFNAVNNDVYLIKTDANGDTLWSKTYGGTGDDYGIFVQQTADGGYVISGRTTGAGNEDIYLIRTNAGGDTLWTKSFGGIANDYAYPVQQTADGGYIITGITNSFGSGNDDVYLIKTDADGNTGCNQSGTAAIVSSVTSQVANPGATISSGGTVTIPAAITKSGGVITSLCASVGINEITSDNSVIISPNPTAGNFSISFGKTIMKGTIEIVTLTGQNIFAEQVLHETKKEINLKNILCGIYFVKVFDGEKYYCRKIIFEQD